jgi:hypothetical protein
MPEYAQKVAKRTGGADGARGWTRPTSHATVSAPGGTDGGPAGTLQALLNEAPAVQAVTEIKGALNRRGSSLQVAHSQAAFHDAPVDVAQGRFEMVPREQGVEEADSPPGLTGLEMVHASLNRATLVEHTAQLRRSLNQSPRVARLAVLSGAVQRTAAAGPPIQRLELTDEMWTHIAKGELRDGNKLVGYHWTGDANAIAEKNGESKQGPDALGVYVEGVQTREQYGQGKKRAPIKKAKASSFWPDGWSAAEIKNAIANGGAPRNNVSEVGVKATKADARGMSLYVNPDSVFPVIGETAEAVPRGGRKKKGGRG